MDLRFGGTFQEPIMSFPAPTRRAFLAAGIAAALLPAPRLASPALIRACWPKCRRKLSGVSTMNGEFIQFDPNGEQRQGKFFIARPGRVRFQYDPPMAISVVADGKSVMIHDKKLQTYDIYPLSQTPCACCSTRTWTCRPPSGSPTFPSRPI
jgi:outer membrane lipoprotein-sorting protein